MSGKSAGRYRMALPPIRKSTRIEIVVAIVVGWVGWGGFETRPYNRQSRAAIVGSREEFDPTYNDDWASSQLQNGKDPMIPRYTRPEMASIWDPQTRYRIWFEIEAHAADAMAEMGIIPKEAAEKIWEKGKDATFDIARIDTIEREVKHDVIAFLTHLAEIVGPQARFVHQGMTSSDVLDTCFNVQLVRACDILIADIERLLAALKRRAFEHKLTPTIGRSHGIHAEPTTFGLKLAYAYAEFHRAKERLVRARTEVATCAISGAVGTFAQVDPRVEARVAEAMGLAVEPVSTQIIPRDRHAMYFATLGVVAASIERLATEIRHLQRTEVLEAEEFFSESQKGSSAMPHKRNPVLSENVTGLARMVRAYVTPALENVALWHERDISHSSVERMIGPDATATLDFALARLASIVDKLVIYPANMKKNLERLGGLVHSQRIMIALTQKGVAREDAYRLVQRNAMRVWQGEGEFLAFLAADKDLRTHLSEAELAQMFDMDHHFRHVDTIFQRVFGT
jgi:adenylosuccinate lyase